MKPLKPEETRQVPGAARTPNDDLVGLDPIPMPLPQPVEPEIDFLPLQEAP